MELFDRENNGPVEIQLNGIVETCIPIILSLNVATSKLSIDRLERIFPEIFKSVVAFTERHSFIYKLLMSENIQKRTVRDLCHGDLWKIMTVCSSYLQCPVYTSTSSSPQAISLGIITRTLLPILWDLGGDSVKHQSAVKALQVFCTLTAARVWSIPRSIIATNKNKIQEATQDEGMSSMNSLFEQVTHYINSFSLLEMYATR